MNASLRGIVGLCLLSLSSTAWADATSCEEHWKTAARTNSSPGSDGMGVLELILRGGGLDLPPDGWHAANGQTWREVSSDASITWQALVDA
jgi:hypothetical protein